MLKKAILDESEWAIITEALDIARRQLRKNELYERASEIQSIKLILKKSLEINDQFEARKNYIKEGGKLTK